MWYWKKPLLKLGLPLLAAWNLQLDLFRFHREFHTTPHAKVTCWVLDTQFAKYDTFLTTFSLNKTGTIRATPCREIFSQNCNGVGKNARASEMAIVTGRERSQLATLAARCDICVPVWQPFITVTTSLCPLLPPSSSRTLCCCFR